MTETSNKEQITSARDQQCYEMARRMLWLAFVWNDHNFEHPIVVAQNEAGKHGIHSFEQANAWLESFEVPATGLVSEFVQTQAGDEIDLWNNPGFSMQQRLEMAAGAVVFWRRVAENRKKQRALPTPQPKLPPYVYGRETGANEKVFTEADVRAYGLACYEAGAGRGKGEVAPQEAAADDASHFLGGGLAAATVGAADPALSHTSAVTLVQEPSTQMIEVCMRAMHEASQGDFDPTVGEAREICRAVLARATLEAKPLDMVLHCPECGLQHVDEPDDRTPGWENPPHRSHLCHGCQTVWRPADVATNGVCAVATRGKADTWPGLAQCLDDELLQRVGSAPDMGGAMLQELSEFMVQRQDKAEGGNA